MKELKNILNNKIALIFIIFITWSLSIAINILVNINKKQDTIAEIISAQEKTLSDLSIEKKRYEKVYPIISDVKVPLSLINDKVEAEHYIKGMLTSYENSKNSKDLTLVIQNNAEFQYNAAKYSKYLESLSVTFEFLNRIKEQEEIENKKYFER